MRFRFHKRLGARMANRSASKRRFAWVPKKLSNGTIVWLESYRLFDPQYEEYREFGFDGAADRGPR